MKRPDKAADKAIAGGDFSDAKFREKYPLLFEYLHDTQWDDGSAREQSSITVKIEQGRFNLALSDKDARASLYITADTIVDGLACFEKALKAGNADWRGWKGSKGKK